MFLLFPIKHQNLICFAQHKPCFSTYPKQVFKIQFTLKGWEPGSEMLSHFHVWTHSCTTLCSNTVSDVHPVSSTHFLLLLLEPFKNDLRPLVQNNRIILSSSFPQKALRRNIISKAETLFALCNFSVRIC